MSSKPVELSRVRFPLQTVEDSLGFAQTIKTSKADRWFGLIGNVIKIVIGRKERVLLQWSLTLDVILIVLITDSFYDV